MKYKVTTYSSNNMKVLQEGVIDKIKEFFSRIINAIRNFFAKVFGKAKNKTEKDLKDLKKNIQILEKGHENVTSQKAVDDANENDSKQSSDDDTNNNQNIPQLPEGKRYKVPKFILENVLDLSAKTTIDWVNSAVYVGESFIRKYTSFSDKLGDYIKNIRKEFKADGASAKERNSYLAFDLKIDENLYSQLEAYLKSKPKLLEKIDNAKLPEPKEIERLLTEILNTFNRLNKFKDKFKECIDKYQRSLESNTKLLTEKVCNKILTSINTYSSKILKLIDVNIAILMRLEDEYQKILNVYMRYKNHPCEDDTITITFSPNIKGISEGVIVYGGYGIFSEISMI